MNLTIDEGTLWLVREVLRRNGRPDASADDAIAEIKMAISGAAEKDGEAGAA